MKKKPESEQSNSILLSGITPVWPLKLIFSFFLLGLGIYNLVANPPNTTAQVIGIIFMVSGGSINVIHYLIIKKQAKELGSPDRLVTTGGLFPFIRHPMYLGDLTMFTGFAVMGNVISIIATTLFLIILIILTFQEDRLMESRFPADFPVWKKKTRRLLPFVF